VKLWTPFRAKCKSLGVSMRTRLLELMTKDVTEKDAPLRPFPRPDRCVWCGDPRDPLLLDTLCQPCRIVWGKGAHLARSATRAKEKA
jgi:hypothetical protein